jgi:hypothetical protein
VVKRWIEMSVFSSAEPRVTSDRNFIERVGVLEVCVRRMLLIRTFGRCLIFLRSLPSRGFRNPVIFPDRDRTMFTLVILLWGCFWPQGESDGPEKIGS